MSDESRKAFEAWCDRLGRRHVLPSPSAWAAWKARDAEIAELSRRLRTAQELHDSDIVVIGQIHARNEALKARVEGLKARIAELEKQLSRLGVLDFLSLQREQHE